MRLQDLTNFDNFAINTVDRCIVLWQNVGSWHLMLRICDGRIPVLDKRCLVLGRLEQPLMCATDRMDIKNGHTDTLTVVSILQTNFPVVSLSIYYLHKDSYRWGNYLFCQDDLFREMTDGQRERDVLSLTLLRFSLVKDIMVHIHVFLLTIILRDISKTN